MMACLALAGSTAAAWDFGARSAATLAGVTDLAPLTAASEGPATLVPVAAPLAPQPPAAGPPGFAPTPLVLSSGAPQNFSPFSPSAFTHGQVSIGPNVDGVNIDNLPSIAVNQTGNITIAYNGTWNPAPATAADRDWVLAIVLRNGSPAAVVLEANASMRVNINASQLPWVVYFGLPTPVAGASPTSTARITALPPSGNLTILNLTAANAGISLAGNAALPPMLANQVWLNASGSYGGSGNLSGPQTMVVFVPADAGPPLEVRSGRLTQWSNASHFPGGRFLALKSGSVIVIGGTFKATAWTRGSPESALYLNATVYPTFAVRPDALNVTGTVGNRSLEQTTGWNMTTSAVMGVSPRNSANCNQVVRLTNGSYRLFCAWQDSSGGGTYGVDSAFSRDGTAWAWEPGLRYSACSDKHSITQIAIVRLLDGTLRMYYDGSDPALSSCSLLGNTVRTSSATSSNEGVTWTLESDPLSDFTVAAPQVRTVVPTTGGQLRMYLDSNSGLSSALSDDGLTWAFESAVTASIPREVYALASGGYKMYFGTSTVQSRTSANGITWSAVQTEVAQWGIGNIEAGPILDRGDGFPQILVFSQGNGLFLGSVNRSLAPAARVDVAGRLSDGTPFGGNSTAAGAGGSFQENSTVPAPAPLGRYQLTASAGFGENKFRGVVINRPPVWTGPTQWNATEDVPLVINFSSFASDADIADTLTVFAAGANLTMNGSVGTLLYPNGVLSGLVLGVINDGHDNTFFGLTTTVTPVNDAPTLALNASYTVTEDQLSQVDLSGTYADEETPANLLNLSTNLSGATVLNGVVSVNLPDPGNVSVTVTVSDGFNNVSATTGFVVLPRDDAPTLVLDPVYRGNEGALVVLDFAPGISDPDTPLGSLVLSTNLTPSAVAGFTVSLQRDLPMTIAFNVTLSDGNNTVVATSLLIIDPTNDAPRWIGAPDLSGLMEDVAFGVALAPLAADEETASGQLTYSADSIYATINGTNLTLLYPEGVLSETFNLTVSDGEHSAIITVAATIAAVNDAPVFTNAPPSNYTGNGSLAFQFNVSDPDNTGGFIFDLQTNVSWITLSSTGQLTINPTELHGHFAYSVRVRDASGATAGYQNYTIAMPGNRLPEMSPPFSELPADAILEQLFEISFTVSDADNDSVATSIVGFDLSQAPALTPLGPNHWRLSWTPTYPGTHTTPFVRWLNGTLLLDDSFGVARFPFSIRAMDPPSHAPTIDAIPAIIGNSTQTLQIDLTTYMHDQDPVDTIDRLSWTLEVDSATGSFVSANVTGRTLTVHFNANGTGSLRLILTDPGHLSAFQFVTVKTYVAEVVPPITPTTDFPWWLLLVLVAGAAAAAAVVWRSRASALIEALSEAPAPAAASAPAPPPQATPAARPPPVLATVPRRTFVVEDLFLLYRDGRTIFARSGLGADAVDDPESVGAMLIAVQDFVKDSFRKGSPMDRMGYGDNLILLEQGEYALLAVTVFGEPDRDFRELLSETLKNVEASYAGIIEAWSGNKADFRGVESILAPVWQLTAHLTRGDVLLATVAREVQMLSGVEFFQGFVRLKVGIVNNTATVITNVTVDIDHSSDVLRLHKIEPPGYKASGPKVNLGVLQSGEKATLAYYFDPQICTMSMIDGTARYKDAEGAQHVVQMKSRKAEVVCPLFFTKEQANTAMLRRLVETELNQFDVRAFGIAAGAKAGELSSLFETMKSSVMAHDVQIVRSFEHHNPYAGEAWFYGKTQVKGYQMIIRGVVDQEKGRAEFFVASTAMRSVTGLLAELSHQFVEDAQKRFAALSVEALFDENVRNEYADARAVSKMIEGEAAAGETDAP